MIAWLQVDRSFSRLTLHFVVVVAHASSNGCARWTIEVDYVYGWTTMVWALGMLGHQFFKTSRNLSERIF